MRLLHLALQECPEDVFLEGILQPCLERGRLGVLQGLLETLDATLESWGRYLIPACQMLQRKGHFHTLYQLQQFMMVLKTHLNRNGTFLASHVPETVFVCVFRTTYEQL